MGKYASGTDMKTVITSEVADVQKILARSNLCAEDKKAVINAMKEMAYQWCSSNASACAMESEVTKLYGADGAAAIAKGVIHNGVYEAKMADTYPFT